MNLRLIAATLVALPLVIACGGGAASEPPVTNVHPQASTKLEFAVGVATIAHSGTVAYGLNTVSTLRQADGLSGTLYNIPKITGPSNFSVTTSTETGNQVLSAGADLGTNHISWATLNQSLWIGATLGVKQASTGVFGYGLCPCNADAGGQNGTPSLYLAFNLPIYGNDEERFYGGPPAFPRAAASVASLGFLGYSLGFTDFAVAPVLGRYRLTIQVPPNYLTPGLPTPSPQPGISPPPAPVVIYSDAQITKLAPLPAFSTPAFTPDGKGGGTVHVAMPRGAVEAMVVVQALANSGNPSCARDRTSDLYYTLVAHGSGARDLSLADNLGPPAGASASSPTLCPQSTYAVYAAGFNYHAYEAAYPQNLSVLPTISGANGQADVTTSDILNGTYP